MEGTQKLFGVVAEILTTCVLSCSTDIGQPEPDVLATYNFGPPQEVKLCVYLDNGVSREQAENLLSSWQSDAQQYSLSVRPISFEPMHSSGFLYRECLCDVD